MSTHVAYLTQDSTKFQDLVAAASKTFPGVVREGTKVNVDVCCATLTPKKARELAATLRKEADKAELADDTRLGHLTLWYDDNNHSQFYYSHLAQDGVTRVWHLNTSCWDTPSTWEGKGVKFARVPLGSPSAWPLSLNWLSPLGNLVVGR